MIHGADLIDDIAAGLSTEATWNSERIRMTAGGERCDDEGPEVIIVAGDAAPRDVAARLNRNVRCLEALTCVGGQVSIHYHSCGSSGIRRRRRRTYARTA